MKKLTALITAGAACAVLFCGCTADDESSQAITTKATTTVTTTMATEDTSEDIGDKISSVIDDVSSALDMSSEA